MRVTLRDRVFQFYWRRSRAMTLGVRVIAFDPEGRVALVRHSYMPGWHFPGGGVERNETTQDAAERELLEETGAEAAAPLDLLSVHSNHTRFPNDHILVFRTQVATASTRPPDREIVEVRWADPADLPEGVTPATQRRVLEVLNGTPPAPLW